MKTTPPALLAHYASDAMTTALLWKLTRRGGQAFAFTDHDVTIPFGGVDYAPSSAFDASAVPTNADLNTDSLEAVGLLDAEGITAADMEAGVWDGASVELRRVNWANLADGAEVVRVGEIGEVHRDGGTYRAEIRGLTYALQNNIGRTVTPACDATLGDARCGVDLEALRVAGTVTAATSSRVFAISLGGADTYNYGVITWTAGANAGLSMEVKLHAAGELTLQLAMPHPVEAGDAFTIVPGCDKRKETCKATFSNVVNFRGFSFVPGQDQVLRGGE